MTSDPSPLSTFLAKGVRLGGDTALSRAARPGDWTLKPILPEEMGDLTLDRRYSLPAGDRKRIRSGKMRWPHRASELLDLCAMLYPTTVTPPTRLEVAETASAILSCTGEPGEDAPRAIAAARSLVERRFTIPESTVAAFRRHVASYAQTPNRRP